MFQSSLCGFSIALFSGKVSFILISSQFSDYNSYSYTLFFAVNHWTDESSFTDNSNINTRDWGVIQIENSSNFAIDSKFWTALSGGLNH